MAAKVIIKFQFQAVDCYCIEKKVLAINTVLPSEDF